MDRLESQVSCLVRLALANQLQHEEKMNRRNTRVEIQAPLVRDAADPIEVFEEQYEREIASELAANPTEISEAEEEKAVREPLEQHYAGDIEALNEAVIARIAAFLTWAVRNSASNTDSTTDPIAEWGKDLKDKRSTAPRKGKLWERDYRKWVESILPASANGRGSNGKGTNGESRDDVWTTQIKIEERYAAEIARAEQRV